MLWIASPLPSSAVAMIIPSFDLFAQYLVPSLLLSFVLSGLLVWSERWHGHLSFDRTEGVQRMHTNRVPRIGGLAIFTTVVIVNGWQSSGPSFGLTSSMLVMGVLIFSFGFVEDITQKVGVGLRMWASLLPGFIAYFLTSEYLVSLDFAWLDAILAVMPIGLAFTAFAISGMTHAMNFLDGLNGLSAWSALWILLGLTTLAMVSGSALELAPTLILAGAIGGFLIWNWPFGKLFLGDGGAYFIGTALAWLAISLSIHNPSVTSWSMLLLCAYPVTEALYSIYRRSLNRSSSGAPDRAHLHQLIASVWIYPRFSSIPLVMRNSLSGMTASLINIPPLLLTLTFHDNKWACIASYLLFVLGYIASYQALSKSMVAEQVRIRAQKAGGVK